MHTETLSVTIQGNITVVRCRNDVIQSVLLLHIRANLGMMLAREYASCHPARSALVMVVVNNLHKFRWLAKSLNLNPINHLLGLLKRAQLLQWNLRELTRVIRQMCAVIPQQYIHRHMLSIRTRFTVDAISGGCSKCWSEIKYNVNGFCSFRFKGDHVNPLIPVIKFQWSFVLYVRSKLY